MTIALLQCFISAAFLCQPAQNSGKANVVTWVSVIDKKLGCSVRMPTNQGGYEAFPLPVFRKGRFRNVVGYRLATTIDSNEKEDVFTIDVLFLQRGKRYVNGQEIIKQTGTYRILKRQGARCRRYGRISNASMLCEINEKTELETIVIVPTRDRVFMLTASRSNGFPIQAMTAQFLDSFRVEK